ncbi:hypothetical protein [Dactylosporangium fulvum]|uniref:DUF3592 domain-containing protein n=1 Tax=Dactylosporangium fulvum TaxID=53359 RepID=A0ABY5VT86_9ACTN|nr:hypothetical protein [Dactylosporangium fulvum]UWP80041.1 hypothetical protein Dfulv_33425 [Dactylosporangium fulvum]
MTSGADPVGRPSRYEKVVLGWIQGEGKTAVSAGVWLLATSLLTAVFIAALGWQVWENLALSNRGEIGEARVVRTNYEGRSPSLNVVYLSGPVGKAALIDNPVKRPSTDDVIHVLYDPHHPTTIREVGAPIWRWFDYLVIVPFAVAGGLIVPAQLMRFRRRLRERHIRKS